MDKATRQRFSQSLDLLGKRKTTEVSFKDCQCGDGGIKGFDEGGLDIARTLIDLGDDGHPGLQKLNLSGLNLTDKVGVERCILHFVHWNYC